MHSSDSPEIVVQRQLDAYNRRDVEAWASTYADDAKQFELPGKLLASGGGEIRARVATRFQEPNLHARLLHRTVMGHVVIDHEVVSRTFPEGTGTVELVAIYEVRDGKIQTGTFAFGATKFD